MAAAATPAAAVLARLAAGCMPQCANQQLPHTMLFVVAIAIAVAGAIARSNRR